MFDRIYEAEAKVKEMEKELEEERSRSEDLEEALREEKRKRAEELLEDFKKKLDEAYDAREEVIFFLEENFKFDGREEAEEIEEECTWVYGIDEDFMQEIIKDRELIL